MMLLVQGLYVPQQSLDPDGNIGFATSAIETNLALITASAPALRPLLRAWFPRLLGASGRDDQVEGATARRVLGFGFGGGGFTSTATSTIGPRRTRLTRAKSISTQQHQQAKMVQTRCERASTGDSRKPMIKADKNKKKNKGSKGSSSSSKKHPASGFAGDDDDDEMMKALPFAAAARFLPHNAIIRRSDIHILYEPNPSVCAAAAARTPSEERKRFAELV